MRYTGFILLCLLSFIACKKKERVIDTTAPCIKDINNDPAYVYEELNKDYDIAFLSGYTHGGYIVFEGDYFIKQKASATDTIRFIAQYGPATGHKSVYGEALVNTEATQVDIEYKNQLYTLKNKKRLCSDGGIGYYFYTTDRHDSTSKNTGLGVIYLLQGSDFRQNLVIDFPAAKVEEVNSVLASIKKKKNQ